MADTVERLIYELQFDDQGFIRGIDGASASLQRLIQVQNIFANNLRTNELALKNINARVAESQKNLEDYTGTDAEFRQQLERLLQRAIDDQKLLTEEVQKNQKSYDDATKAVQNYINVAQRASNITLPSGQIQAPGILPPTTTGTVAAEVGGELTQKLGGIEFTDIEEHAHASIEAVKLVAEAVEELTRAFAGLGTETEEFKQLSIIGEAGQKVLAALTEVSEGTVTSLKKIPAILVEMNQKLKEVQATGPQVFTRLQAQVQQFGGGVKTFKPIVLDPNTVTSVKNVTVALQGYDQEVQQVTQHHVSLRAQIQQGIQALHELEEQGKEDSAQYRELEKEVARLTQRYREQRQIISVLASETRGLNFGKAAIATAISGFQALTAVQILFGKENDKLQHQISQLFAAMQLLASVEQIAVQIRRGGVIATELSSAATAAYTAITKAATVAGQTFNRVLLTTGIGAAVVGLGILITKLIEHKKAAEAAAEKAKLFNDINKQAGESAAGAVVKLEQLRKVITDTNKPLEERTAAVKAYNEEADKSNQIDEKQINNLDEINKKIEAQIGLVIQRARSAAALSKITESESKAIEAQLALDEKLQESQLTEEQLNNILTKQDKERSEAFLNQQRSLDGVQKSIVPFINKNKQLGENIVTFSNQEIAALRRLVNERDRTRDESKKLAEELQKFIVQTPTKVETPKPDTKEIENVFEKERADLLARLAELRRSQFQSIQKINEEFAAKLAVEKVRILGLLGKNQITADQAKILVDLSIEINQLQLAKALNDFGKQVADARKKILDELTKRRQQNQLDEAALIENEFEQRRIQIDINQQKELDDRVKNDTTLVETLEENRRKGLIKSDQELEKLRSQVIINGTIAVSNILEKFSKQREALAVDVFKRVLKGYDEAFQLSQLTESETTTVILHQLTQRFLQGQISYKNFQKETTRIQREEASKRRDIELSELNQQLDELDDYIANYVDKNSKFYKELVAQRDQLRTTINTKRREDDKADADDRKKQDDDAKEKIQQIQKYAEAIGAVANSVIQFWAKTNEAEQKALDRSIALQQSRVEAAQRIADRGNATYLKSEQDRLQQLQVQRENAARRQLGIDAALQASQVLTGITGAIAKISTGIGAAETIAEIAVIIGALATGYSLVKSLQANQPRLKAGTKSLQRGDHPRGIDTIPVMANEGEAIIPTEINRVYHPTVSAIYDKRIPPEVVNKFVDNYVNKRVNNYVNNVNNDTVSKFVNTYNRVQPVQVANWVKIKEVADIHIAADSSLQKSIDHQNKLLLENNDLQRQTLRALKTMGVNVNVDKDGLAISVMEAIDQLEKEQKL